MAYLISASTIAPTRTPWDGKELPWRHWSPASPARPGLCTSRCCASLLDSQAPLCLAVRRRWETRLCKKWGLVKQMGVWNIVIKQGFIWYRANIGLFSRYTIFWQAQGAKKWNEESMSVWPSDHYRLETWRMAAVTNKTCPNNGQSLRITSISSTTGHLISLRDGGFEVDSRCKMTSGPCR